MLYRRMHSHVKVSTVVISTLAAIDYITALFPCSSGLTKSSRLCRGKSCASQLTTPISYCTIRLRALVFTSFPKCGPKQVANAHKMPQALAACGIINRLMLDDIGPTGRGVGDTTATCKKNNIFMAPVGPARHTASPQRTTRPAGGGLCVAASTTDTVPSMLQEFLIHLDIQYLEELRDNSGTIALWATDKLIGRHLSREYLGRRHLKKTPRHVHGTPNGVMS